jgi:hypothetical protein
MTVAALARKQTTMTATAATTARTQKRNENAATRVDDAMSRESTHKIINKDDEREQQ